MLKELGLGHGGADGDELAATSSETDVDGNGQIDLGELLSQHRIRGRARLRHRQVHASSGRGAMQAAAEARGIAPEELPDAMEDRCLSNPPKARAVPTRRARGRGNARARARDALSGGRGGRRGATGCSPAPPHAPAAGGRSGSVAPPGGAGFSAEAFCASLAGELAVLVGSSARWGKLWAMANRATRYMPHAPLLATPGVRLARR